MSHRSAGATRRLVLGAAFAFAMAAWLLPHPPAVRAASPADPYARIAQADTKSGAKAATAPAAKEAAKPAAPPTDTDAKDVENNDSDAKSDADITIDPRGVRIHKGRKHVRIDGFGHEREYASFEDFVQDAPWLAGLVFLTVLLVFLVPLLIIVLLIWYKVRKTRMLNETMLKLAEKGVMPPAEAMEALSASRGGPALTAGPTMAPLYEQAKLLRRRAAWSDLRKGVIMIAIGFGLSAFSMFDDGTANSVGLVLLFVGIGYCVLWIFEEREPARTGVPPAASGAPPPGGT